MSHCFCCHRAVVQSICGVCKHASYCSSTCQQQDWKSGKHKQLCGRVITTPSGERLLEVHQDSVLVVVSKLYPQRFAVPQLSPIPNWLRLVPLPLPPAAIGMPVGSGKRPAEGEESASKRTRAVDLGDIKRLVWFISSQKGVTYTETKWHSLRYMTQHLTAWIASLMPSEPLQCNVVTPMSIDAPLEAEEQAAWEAYCDSLVATLNGIAQGGMSLEEVIFQAKAMISSIRQVRKEMTTKRNRAWIDDHRPDLAAFLTTPLATMLPNDIREAVIESALSDSDLEAMWEPELSVARRDPMEFMLPEQFYRAQRHMEVGREVMPVLKEITEKFTGLIGLTVFYNLPDGVEYLTGLDSLSLQLHTISAEAFAPIGMLTRLRKLAILVFGSIPSPNTLSQLQSLKELRLNTPDKPPAEIFTLLGLESLELLSSQLNPPLLDDLGELTGLKRLSVLSASMHSLPQTIGMLTNLEELSLLKTGLQILPDALTDLVALTKLELDLDSIRRSLPPVVGNLIRLENLVLRNASFLYPSLSLLSQLTRLRHLGMMSCDLERLPSIFSALVSLRSLTLSKNELAAVPYEINSMTNLEELDISENKISYLHDSLTKLVNLRSLNCAYNRLPSDFPAILSLQDLNMKGTRLTLEGVRDIARLTNLRKLNLARNDFPKLPSRMSALVNLQELNLTGVLFNVLPPVIEQLTKLEVLYINPWLTTIPALRPKLPYLRHLGNDNER